jgi:micrococcal nuclease
LSLRRDAAEIPEPDRDELAAGIDAPEKGQPFGTKSRENLAVKVFGQVVRVELFDVDRYKREVGRIFLGERFVNMEMVRDGFAWR